MYKATIDKQLKKLGLQTEINPDQYDNLLSMYADMLGKYAERPAFTSLGRTITYKELDDLRTYSFDILVKPIEKT